MQSLLEAVQGKYGTILIDPPWRFANRTGKMAPEHKRLHRYPTMSFEEIAALPVGNIAPEKSHLYLWCPNALLAETLGTKEGAGVYIDNSRNLRSAMTSKQLSQLLARLPKELQNLPIIVATDQEGNEFRLLEDDPQNVCSTGTFEQVGISSFEETVKSGPPTHLCLWPGYPRT